MTFLEKNTTVRFERSLKPFYIYCLLPFLIAILEKTNANNKSNHITKFKLYPALREIMYLVL